MIVIKYDVFLLFPKCSYLRLDGIIAFCVCFFCLPILTAAAKNRYNLDASEKYSKQQRPKNMKLGSHVSLVAKADEFGPDNSAF